VVSKDEWDTKEDPGKSMKNAFYAWQKAPLRLKRCQTEKKINPVALAYASLKESGSYLVSIKISSVKYIMNHNSDS